MVALIPARGGSKGLPRKNIKLLNGLPLIAYSIEAALKSPLVSEVFVDTDNLEIAKVAESYGATIPYIRPSYLASDSATTADVLLNFKNWYNNHSNKNLDNLLLLQPTSPLRTSNHINEAINIFFSKNAESVVSCSKNVHPIFWSKYINDEGKFENIFESEGNQRQLFRETFFPNGSIYILSSILIDLKQIYSKNTYSYIMDQKHSVDIDTLDDFQYAEFLLSK